MKYFAFMKVFNKIKTYILLAPALIFVFFSGIYEPLLYVACVFIALFFLCLSTKEIFNYFLFIEFFAGYEPFFMTSLISIFVSICLRYVIGLIKKKERLYLKPLILTIIILAFFSLIHYRIDGDGIIQGMIVYGVLLGVYLCFVYRRHIDVSKCISFAFMGLIISVGMSILTYIFPHYSLQILVKDSEEVSRLKLLMGNPNHLSIMCLLLISIYIHELINRHGETWINLMCVCICTIFGFLSMSKAFLVVFFGFIMYILIYIIIKYKKKSLRVILPIILLFALLLVIFNDFFRKLFSRFIIYGGDLDSLMYKITTGRSEIWQQYITSIVSSIATMLFGFGLFNENLPINTPHNAFIFYLYRMGFIGIILLGLLIYFYVVDSGEQLKIRYSRLLPLLTILAISMEEMIINERFFIFLVLSVILISDRTVYKKNYETTINENLIKFFKIDKQKLENSKDKIVKSVNAFVDKISPVKSKKNKDNESEVAASEVDITQDSDDNDT